MEGYCGLFFADHQVEYIVSLTDLKALLFSRMNISRLTNIQRNPRNLRPSKISAYMVIPQWHVVICQSKRYLCKA